MTERQYLLLFSSFIELGPLRARLLLKYFGSAKKVWEAEGESLLKTGLGAEITKRFLVHKNRLNENYFNRLESLGISTLTIFEKDYPKNLKEIEDAPLVLYLKGRLTPEDTNAIAIIGSRKMSEYGRYSARFFAKELAGLGITIISGLARGVDTEAHRASLNMGGRTLAVLGAGLDTLYPPENLALAREIMKEGALISEYPPGYPIRPYNFVARNRIVSGLSKAVLVIEGEEKSGTLITATHAANQGRTVFAVPGAITSSLSGAPHFLLKNGAKMATGIGDILEEMEGEIKTREKFLKEDFPAGYGEPRILSYFGKDPLQLDTLARISSLEASTLFVKLANMEARGLVKNLGGGFYRRVFPSKDRK